jgi:hypothetical protein
VTYTLTLTERQAHVVSQACEVFARIQIGQLIEAVRLLPAFKADRDGEILKRAASHLARDVERAVTTSMHAAEPEARIAWDVHQVVRHQLAWDWAIEKGYVDSRDDPRTAKMIAVTYDTPQRMGDEPLPVIAKGA